MDGIGTEMRFTIPRVLVKAFGEEPRFLLKVHPAGLWPVDPWILQRPEVLQSLINDEEFVKNFEIVIMPRA